MGNCSLRGVSDTAKTRNFISIMTDSGEILKLKGPKLVGEVICSFPGYKMFCQGRFSTPLFDHEQLIGGQFYYLLPQQPPVVAEAEEDGNQETEAVRMSSSSGFDLVKGSGFEVLAPQEKGVWRVKLAISSRQLEEILAEEVDIEALIEQMRMAASSSSSSTPRRTDKSSWRVLKIWKPILANLIKGSLGEDQQMDQVKSVDFYTNSTQLIT